MHKTLSKKIPSAFEIALLTGTLAIVVLLLVDPVKRGLALREESNAAQDAKSLAEAETQYSVDNGGSFPPATGTTCADVAKPLLAGGYVSDPSLFVLGSVVPYRGMNSANEIEDKQISWTFVGRKEAGATSTGLVLDDPDQLPVVFNAGDTIALAPNTQLRPTLGHFGHRGLAICYKSLSAFFLKPATAGGSVTIIDAHFVALAGVTYTLFAGGNNR